MKTGQVWDLREGTRQPETEVRPQGPVGRLGVGAVGGGWDSRRPGRRRVSAQTPQGLRSPSSHREVPLRGSGDSKKKPSSPTAPRGSGARREPGPESGHPNCHAPRARGQEGWRGCDPRHHPLAPDPAAPPPPNARPWTALRSRSRSRVGRREEAAPCPHGPRARAGDRLPPGSPGAHPPFCPFCPFWPPAPGAEPAGEVPGWGAASPTLGFPPRATR